MTGRRPPKLVLIGSWPRPTIEAAVADMIDHADIAVSGGEVGAEWKDWAKGAALKIRRQLGLKKSRLSNEGDKYWHYVVRRPRRASSVSAADLPALGYAERVAEEWQVFRRLRAERGRDDLKFLVGIPMPYALAMLSGPFIGNVDAFTDKLVDEITAICRMDDLRPEDLVIQFELPFELVTYTMVTPALRPKFARWVGRTLSRLRDAAPPGVNFALHLCWGDLGGKALLPFTSMKATVEFANALAADWPEHQPLLYVHIPCGAGKQRPPARKWRYRWLRKLKLPANTLLVAGIIHHRQGDERLRRVWTLVREAYSGKLAVSFPCGCGRHTPDEAIRGCEQRNTLVA